ncbi:hypothetical protein ACSQ67_026219 [Phaseolus vulgaris]
MIFKISKRRVIRGEINEATPRKLCALSQLKTRVRTIGLHDSKPIKRPDPYFSIRHYLLGFLFLPSIDALCYGNSNLQFASPRRIMVGFGNRYMVMEVFVNPSRDKVGNDSIIITRFNVSKAVKDDFWRILGVWFGFIVGIIPRVDKNLHHHVSVSNPTMILRPRQIEDSNSRTQRIDGRKKKKPWKIMSDRGIRAGLLMGFES